jgi:undecaprenyl-diphosphatase
MPLITSLGNLGLVWIGFSLYFLKNRLYRTEGLMVLSALVLTTTVGEGIIKHLIRRIRPFADESQETLLISKPITYSFPSGHTASSFAAAGIFIATSNPLAVYAVIIAALIAFSRLYLNVHYPTDVISGIILGLICSNVIINIFSTIA